MYICIPECASEYLYTIPRECMHVVCIFKCLAEQMSAFMPVCIHVPKCEGILMCLFMLRKCGHACIAFTDTHI